MPSASDLQTDLQHALGNAYTIRRELPGGGMSRVFVAHDESLGRDVVVKVLSPRLALGVSADRFARETRLAAALQEPHIVPVLSAGLTAEGLPWYTMPFVDGASLRARMDAGPVPAAEAAGILRNIAQALAYAHARGVVHRDIKPENVLLSSGTAMVTDFGIAKALRASRVDAPDGTLTEAGISLGTPAYMAPEQAAGGDVDARADLYSWGVVAYELVAGQHPFHDRSAMQLITAHMTERPQELREMLGERSRDPLALTIAELAMRCLEKEPEARLASADDLVVRLSEAGSRGTGRTSRVVMAVAVIALLAAGLAAAGLWWSRGEARAVASLPRIQALAADGDYRAAWDLAAAAQRHLGGDSAFAAVRAEISNEISIRSTPAGAAVYLTAFGDSTIADSADGTPIGTTPIERHVVPRGDYRLVLRLPGYLPARRIVTRYLTPSEGMNPADRHIELDISLTREGAVPEEMEAVPGGRYAIVGHDIGRGTSTDLAPFAIDRFEVSNARYAEFVRSGRYPAGFVDRTGLPGPRGWRNGDPPADRLDHPVTGVSWQEAAAYCEWRGARLPTLFEWEKASRDGRSSRRGVLMPWGQYDARTAGVTRANFAGGGTVPVNSFPFAISPYGVYNMAGNVKEWLANRVGEGWATVGGSWQDAHYLFNQVGSQSGGGSPAIGFRCAQALGALGNGTSGGAGDQGAGPLPAAPKPPVYQPVDRAEFERLLSHYRYDPVAPNARGGTVTETPDWIRERIWIDGQRGDSILIYLYLPRSAEPPFQTLVHIPSSGGFAAPIPQLVEEVFEGQIKAGRAIVAPVLTGMVERQQEPFTRVDPGSVEFRDRMVRHATEMRLAMDYAAVRPDIDSTRLAYLAVSFGAGSRIGFAAVDPRFRAVVLLGAGVDERVQPTLPEASNVNFAPYIAAPKLVINGRHDEEHPWQTRGKVMWDLLREPKELLLVEGAGHLVPAESRTAEINAFLDRTLGPVARGAASALRDALAPDGGAP